MAETRPATQQPPTLLDLSSNLFSLVLSLRGSSDFGEAEALRQRISTFFSALESEGMHAGAIREDLESVKFALSVFLDETILDSHWIRREEWRDRPLQHQFFGERRGGSLFFTKLNELRQLGENKRPVLEVFHMCLLLGFEGQYKLSGKEQLQAIVGELNNQLGYDLRDHRELKLSPHGKRRDSPSSMVRDTFPFWRIVGMAAGVLLILFVIYYVIASYQTGQAVDLMPSPRS